MKLNKFIFILLALLFIPTVLAQTEVLTYLDDQGNAEFFGSSDSKTLDLPEEIVLKDGRISGETQSLTNKSGDIWTFSFSLEDSEIQAYFPEGTTILETNGEVSFKDSLIKEGQFTIYSQDSIYADYKISDSGDSFLFYFALLFILVILGSFFFYKKHKRKHPNNFSVENNSQNKNNSKAKKSERLKIIESVLNERDKLIINTLKKTGKIKSSYLRKATKIPKASFSRHLQELKKKGLVSLSGEGRNKFVSLKS